MKGKHASAPFSIPDLPSDTRVTQVTVLLRELDEGQMRFARDVDNFLTGGRSERKVESWHTHFAIELKLGLEERERLVVERIVEGVCASDRDREGGEVVREYLGVGEMRGRVVTLGEVVAFCGDQRQRPYTFLRRNCKHFAHNFYESVLCMPQSRFPDFCGRHEAVWRASTNEVCDGSLEGPPLIAEDGVLYFSSSLNVCFFEQM